ncbi:hypothetical protein PanWU01x14_054430, partial [Parasponia andersonii]
NGEIELHLLEVSKTEIGRRFGGRKTLSKAESLWGRYGFVRRRNEAEPVALDSSSKALRYRLHIGQERWWCSGRSDIFSLFLSSSSPYLLEI